MSIRMLLFVAGAATIAVPPLQAQRSRRSSGSHKGIPCGHSYISADKVCHIGTSSSSPDGDRLSSADSAYLASMRGSPPSAPRDGLDTLSQPQLEARAGGRYQPPSWTAGIRAPASSAADVDAIRRERDSLRIVVATMKQMCTGKP